MASICSPRTLLVLAVLQLLDGWLTDGSIICGQDQYYDGVVDGCQPCKGVCLPCNDRQAQKIFCKANCADYYKRHCDTPDHPISKASSTITTQKKSKGEFDGDTGSTKKPDWPEQPSHASTQYRETHILANPLLWLSLGCLLVAILAATVVVFVMCHYARRSMYTQDAPLMSVTPGYSRSHSQLSSSSCATCQQSKKCIASLTTEEECKMMPDIQHGHVASPQRV